MNFKQFAGSFLAVCIFCCTQKCCQSLRPFDRLIRRQSHPSYEEESFHYDKSPRQGPDYDGQTSKYGHGSYYDERTSYFDSDDYFSNYVESKTKERPCSTFRRAFRRLRCRKHKNRGSRRRKPTGVKRCKRIDGKLFCKKRKLNDHQLVKKCKTKDGKRYCRGPNVANNIQNKKVAKETSVKPYRSLVWRKCKLKNGEKVCKKIKRPKSKLICRKKNGKTLCSILKEQSSTTKRPRAKKCKCTVRGHKKSLKTKDRRRRKCQCRNKVTIETFPSSETVKDKLTNVLKDVITAKGDGIKKRPKATTKPSPPVTTATSKRPVTVKPVTVRAPDPDLPECEDDKIAGCDLFKDILQKCKTASSRSWSWTPNAENLYTLCQATCAAKMSQGGKSKLQCLPKTSKNCVGDVSKCQSLMLTEPGKYGS